MDKIILIGSFLLTAVSIVRFLTVARWTTTEKFLSIALFTLLVNTVILYVFYLENYDLLTYFYRWGTLSIFIFVPSCFHYIKYSMSKGKLRNSDLLLYLPALVYFIDYIPFYISGYHTKYDAMMYDFNNDIAHQHIQSHFMPYGSYFFIQNAMGMILALYLFYLIPNYVKMGGKSYFQENRSLVYWNFTLSFLILLTCLPDLLFSITGKRYDFKSFTYIAPCLFLYTLFPLSVLLSPDRYRYSKGFWLNTFKPSHLFTVGELYPYKGVEDILTHSRNILDQRKAVSQPSKNTFINLEYIDTAKAEKIIKSLKSAVAEFEISNDNSMNIARLSAITGYTEQQISGLLNDYLHTDLSTFIRNTKANHINT